MAVFKLVIANGYVGCDIEEEVEIDDDELEEMSEEDIEHYMYEIVQEHFDWYHERIE